MEIRDDGISAVLLRSSISAVKVAAKETGSIDADLSTDERARAAGEFLRGFLKKNSASSAPVFVGIPTHWAVYRYVDVPSVVKENLRETLGYEMEKHVPFASEDTWYDYRVLREDPDSGTIRLILTALRKENMLPYFDIHGGVGRAAFGLETASTALVNYYLDISGYKPVRPCALMFLRGGRLEIQILEGGSLIFSRSLKLADDEELFSFLARELKVAREASGLADRELDAVSIGGPDLSPAVMRLREEGHVVEAADAAIKDNPIEPDMIPAYGLALRGIRKVPVETNLLPQELRRKASKVGLYMMYALAGLVLLGAFGWGTGHIVGQRAEIKRLNLELKTLAAEAEVVQKLKNDVLSLEARIKYLAEFKNRRGAVLEMLRELTERIPKSAWISNMTFSDKGIEIEGYADSASELIPLLDTSPMFKDVGFLSSITKAQGKERFRIGLKQFVPADGPKARQPSAGSRKGAAG